MKKKKDTEVLPAVSGLAVPEQRMVRLSDVNMAQYNPRVMSREQMGALKASLVKHGMVLNLVVQREGMILIGGHQRVTAMRELCIERGWPEPGAIPAAVLDVGDAEARQLNVALNRIDGEFDAYKLGELFSSIRPDMTVQDILATGFSMVEIDQAVSLVTPIDEQAMQLEAEASALSLDGFGRSITFSLEFDTVEHRDEAKELLKALAGPKGDAGAVLLRALRGMSATAPKKNKGRGQQVAAS